MAETISLIVHVAGILAVCLTAQAYDHTVNLTSPVRCDKFFVLRQSQTLGIYYNGKDSSVVEVCKVIVDASVDSVSQICVEVVSLATDCSTGATVLYFPFDTAAIADKIFTCVKPGNWCTSFLDARIEIDPVANHSHTALELRVFTSEGYDYDDSAMVRSAVMTVTAIVCVASVCIVLSIVVVLIVACYCCRRRSIACNGSVVYHSPQSVAMGTTTIPALYQSLPPQGGAEFSQPMVLPRGTGAYSAPHLPPQSLYPCKGQGYPADVAYAAIPPQRGSVGPQTGSAPGPRNQLPAPVAMDGDTEPPPYSEK